MIATGLIFLLGFCIALILALSVAPLVIRRAKRLARREFDATLPATPREIRASLDQVRAEAALEVRRREIAAMEIRERAALERADAGRIARENALLRSQERLSGEAIRARDQAFGDLARRHEARGAEIADLQALLGQAETAIDRLTEEVAVLSQYAPVRVAADREPGEHEDDFIEATDEPEARRRPKALPVPASLQTESVAVPTIELPGAPDEAASMEPAERQDIAEAASIEETSPAADPLLQALGYRPHEDPLSLAQDDADLRENISDMAARILALASRDGAENERLRGLLAAASTTGADAGSDGRLTLADRVAERTRAQPEPLAR